MYFDQLYPAWRETQCDKYGQLFPQIRAFLPANASWLDVGIGKGWLETFLAEKRVRFQRVVGVDISETAIEPKIAWIDYVLDNNFDSVGQFDVVVCWDALHLLKEKNIARFAKKGGLVLVGVSASKSVLLDSIGGTMLAQGRVGVQEQSAFVLTEK